MTEYPYCNRDLLRYPEKYQMSIYEGILFMSAYSKSRHDVLQKLSIDYNKNFEKFIVENFTVDRISIDVIHTYKFLSYILVNRVNKQFNKQNDIILDVLLKKFEITKKIFTSYDKHYKENTGDYFDLRNYILLSANCVSAYKQTSNLKYLNACLKLDDVVISKIDMVNEERFRLLFIIILRAELDCINNLCTKKGIIVT